MRLLRAAAVAAAAAGLGLNLAGYQGGSAAWYVLACYQVALIAWILQPLISEMRKREKEGPHGPDRRKLDGR